MLKILNKTPIQDVEGEIEFYSCLVEDQINNDGEFEIILHTYQVEIYELITHLEKSLNLYPATMKEIWGKIEKYGDYKRNEKVLNAIRQGLMNDNN